MGGKRAVLVVVWNGDVDRIMVWRSFARCGCARVDASSAYGGLLKADRL